MSKPKTAILAQPPHEPSWKAKGPNGTTRVIPYSEMEQAHLQKVYFMVQDRELEHFNKSIRFSELREEIEDEAERRGVILKSIEDDPNRKIGNYFKTKNKYRQYRNK